MADVIAAIGLLKDLGVERAAFFLAGQGAHDLLHGVENFGAAFQPIAFRFDGRDVSVAVEVFQKVRSFRARQGFKFPRARGQCGNEEAEKDEAAKSGHAKDDCGKPR